eukprot:1150855-Pelagomonas_calceolata.AAC.1
MEYDLRPRLPSIGLAGNSPTAPANLGMSDVHGQLCWKHVFLHFLCASKKKKENQWAVKNTPIKEKRTPSADC